MFCILWYPVSNDVLYSSKTLQCGRALSNWSHWVCLFCSIDIVGTKMTHAIAVLCWDANLALTQPWSLLVHPCIPRWTPMVFRNKWDVLSFLIFLGTNFICIFYYDVTKVLTLKRPINLNVIWKRWRGQNGKPSWKYIVLKIQYFPHSLLKCGWLWVWDNHCLLHDYRCLLYP